VLHLCVLLQLLGLPKDTLGDVSKGLTSQPIVFTAVTKTPQHRCTCTNAPPPSLACLPPPSFQLLSLPKDTLGDVSKGLTSQPIAFIAVIKLKPGADVNKFVATREAVAKKAKESYKDVNVAYIKVCWCVCGGGGGREGWRGGIA
jgi:hypothetical protein